MPSLRRVTSNIAAQVIAIAASMGDRIVLVGILLRSWGPDLFSDYAVLQAAASLLTIAELGMQLYFINVEQAARVNGDVASFRRLASIHLGMILAITGTLGCALVLFAIFGDMRLLLNLSHIDERSARLIFLMLALGNLLSMVRSTTTTIYIGAGDFAYSVLLGAVVLILSTAFSAVAASFGAGPVVLSAIFLAVTGVGAGVFVQWDTRRRYPLFSGRPAWPTGREFLDAATHVKWFSLQFVSTAVWLQVPVLILNKWNVGGHVLASFLLLRTIANLLRQLFQITAVGSGIEIATYAHRGELDRAWRLSSQVGLLTTVLCGTSFGAVMCFGRVITLYWTGDETLFDLKIAMWLIAPLVLISPLQQPMWLLQFANMTLAPGLQRLIQVVLGPIFCMVGQQLYGVLGLVIGLAAAEVLSFCAILPFIARISFFNGLVRYCVVALAAGVVALGWSAAVGLGVNSLIVAITPWATLANGCSWVLLALIPAVALSSPSSLRKQVRDRLPTWPGL